MTESVQEMNEDGNNVNDIKMTETVPETSGEIIRYNGDADDNLRLKNDLVVDDKSEAHEEKAEDSKKDHELVQRSKRKADCSDLQHKNKLIKLQLQLREAKRSIKELKEFEIGFIQTLLDPSMKAAVNTIKAQQQKILQLESKLMDRDAKDDLVYVEDLNKNHDTVKTSSTERLTFFKGIDLFPVDMLKYSRDMEKTKSKECIKEAVIDIMCKNNVDPLVTVLVEAEAKDNLETTLKTVEETSSDSEIIASTEATLDNDVRSEGISEANEPVLKEEKALIACSTCNTKTNLNSEITLVSQKKEYPENIIDQHITVDAETSMDDKTVDADTMTDSENIDNVDTMDIDITMEIADHNDPINNMNETNNILDNAVKEAVPTLNSNIVRKLTMDVETPMETRPTIEAATSMNSPTEGHPLI